MKAASALFLASFLVVLSCSCARQNDPQGMPLLYFPNRQRDLGELILDASHSRDLVFDFVNRGTAPVQIGRLVASCDCADARAAKESVLPGKEGRVSVRILPDRAGDRKATVTVYSNDPTNPFIDLVVTWQAVAPLEFDPYRLDFGTLRPGESADRTLRLVRRNDERFPSCRIARLDCTPPENLSAEWVESDSAGSSRARPSSGSTVRVQLLAQGKSGERTGVVTAELNECSQKALRIPISWRVRDAIEVAPQTLLLHVAEGEIGVGKVVVSADPGEELDVERAELLGLALGSEVTIDRLDASRVMVEIAIKLPEQAGLHEGKLQVHCTRPEERALVVPVMAYYQ